MYLKEYYPIAADYRGVGVVESYTRVEAEEILAGVGISADGMVLGGELKFYRSGSRRRVSTTNGMDLYSIPVDAMVYRGTRFYADSINDALAIYAHQVKRYRHDPDVILLWKTPLGTQIIKDYDPVKLEEGKPQKPVNKFFN